MRRLQLLTLILMIGASPAAALDLPARKPGLWDITMTFEGRNLPPQKSQHCIDAETDKLMSSTGNSITQANCQKQDIKNAGGAIVIDSVCKFGEATTTTHGVISGDFNSAYTVKIESTQQGGPPMPGVASGQATHMSIAAKWLGACKPGQRPGDMIMSNGMTMNIHDMQRMQGVVPTAPRR